MHLAPLSQALIDRAKKLGSPVLAVLPDGPVCERDDQQRLGREGARHEPNHWRAGAAEPVGGGSWG